MVDKLLTAGKAPCVPIRLITNIFIYFSRSTILSWKVKKRKKKRRERQGNPICRNHGLRDFLWRKNCNETHLNRTEKRFNAISASFNFKQYFLKVNSVVKGVINKTRHSHTFAQLVVVVNGLYWASKCSF